MEKQAKSSEILTSSPYKNALQKKMDKKLEKIKQAEEKKARKALLFQINGGKVC